MDVLALDLSTNTGWAFFKDGALSKRGLIEVTVRNFNVNNFPEKEAEYPYNIIDVAEEMAEKVLDLYSRLSLETSENITLCIENTVRGKNRNTQRLLEWIHLEILKGFRKRNVRPHYLDPSEWRSLLNMRLTNADKKNNRQVSQGKKRGRITRKHLSVRLANEMFGLNLKIKDNDIADALCLGKAFYLKRELGTQKILEKQTDVLENVFQEDVEKVLA